MRLLFEIDKKNYNPDEMDKAFRRPSARGIIFRGDKIAVIFSRQKQFYKIPGGGIEDGEDMAVAMMREVREESGLVVIPSTVKEYGYVHRIEKGSHEPIFIQDNYYYLCQVEEIQLETEYTENEMKEDFVPMWVTLNEAIEKNEAFCNLNPTNSMIQRELQVLKMVAKDLK